MNFRSHSLRLSIFNLLLHTEWNLVVGLHATNSTHFWWPAV